mmetsp:Transcript_96477/g.186053  ORF Transcript_96477/g.186053 Transcript_96477/m.186053 type:complete len:326 (+) Transcript_96477:28-1005(+)
MGVKTAGHSGPTCFDGVPVDGSPVPTNKPSEPTLLEESCFQRFAPLVAASRDYAQYSGCRFRSSSFDGVPSATRIDAAPGKRIGNLGEPLVVGSIRSRDSGPVLAAKLRAAPAVRGFTKRLQAGEPRLLEELERAFSVVMEESVRNAMVSAFQRLDMWPPRPTPADVCMEDCSYQDVSASFAVIAQRAYNDELHRARDAAEVGGISSATRRAMTAAFLVDFAHAAGLQLPPMPEAQQARFHDFAFRAAELERQQQEEHERQCAQQDESPSVFSKQGCNSDLAVETWPTLASNALVSPKGILAKAKALLLSSSHTQLAGEQGQELR